MASNVELAANFEADLLQSAPVGAIVRDRTEAAARTASDLAPDDPATIGDDLHSSIEGQVALDPRGWHGRVVAKDFKAGWYEFGTSEHAARPFLRPAGEREVGPIERGQHP